MSFGKRWGTRAAAAALIALAGQRVSSAKPGDGRNPTDEELGYSTSRIVLRFTPRALSAASKSNKIGLKRGATPPVEWHAPGALPGLSDRFKTEADAWGVTQLRPMYRTAPKNFQAAQAGGLDRTFVIDVPSGTDTLAMAAAIAALADDVEGAGVDAIGHVAELIPPNDPEFANQYAMNNTGQLGGTPDADIDALEAWMLHTGDLGTATIAIIDTGVHPHPEFAGRLLPGINTVGSVLTSDTSDSCPHGTFVAGVAAAAGNNGMGIAGVSWGAHILPVRVWNGCSGGAAEVAEGIVWAVDNGADVINISLQFCFDIDDDGIPPVRPHPMQDAVDYAAANGVLVVAAAGNSNGCNPGVVALPARYANAVAVSATNMFDLRAGFSNFGNEIELAAPGETIRSTSVQFVCANGTNNGTACTSNAFCTGGGTCTGRVSTYAWGNGTSFASPCVAGLAVLIKSFAPALTAAEIRTVLTTSADDLGTAGRDTSFGFGRINAHHALLQAIHVPWILSSDPANGALDARQPSAPDGTDNLVGWQWLDIKFGGDTSSLVREDFSITDDGGVTPTPTPLTVLPSGAFMRVVLSTRIALAARTTIRHIDSDGAVQLAWLPGDVNGNGVADAADLAALSGSLTGRIAALPVHASDIDRSGLAAPADLLREVDLLNGAGVYAAIPTTLP